MATRGGKDLLALGVQSVWATEPEDFSLLHMLFYIHSGGSLAMLFDTEGGAQETRFVGGSQLVSQRLAERLGDDVVHLEAPVRRIEHGADGVTVVADGLTVRAQRVIVALAPTLAGRIAYDPPLPGHRDQLTQRTPMGVVAKTHGRVRRAVLARRRAQRPGHQRRRPGQADLRQLAAGRLARRAAGLRRGRPRARVRAAVAPTSAGRAVVDTFARLFGPRAAKPERYIERLWSEEEYTRGCYGAHMPTGAWTAYGKALREPIGPIHWAGSEVALIWTGYMDGAVRSGESAAREVSAAL